MHLYIMPCLQQKLQKKIHPGAPAFINEMEFILFSSEHWCLLSLPQQKCLQKQRKKVLFGEIMNKSAIVDFFSSLLT